MSDYNYPTENGVNFSDKDTLPANNAGKIVKGTEFHNEFVSIKTHIESKADIADPTFTGTVTVPNLSVTTAIDGGTINGGTY